MSKPCSKDVELVSLIDMERDEVIETGITRSSQLKLGCFQTRTYSIKVAR